MIVSLAMKEQEEIEEVDDNRLVLSCLCGGQSKILRN